jgi:hypothetical protein
LFYTVQISMCRMSIHHVCWRGYIVVPLGRMSETTTVFLPLLIVCLFVVALTFHPVDKSWIVNFLGDLPLSFNDAVPTVRIV